MIKIARSKFNVTKDTEKRTSEGIVFDSKMEMRYYDEVVIPLFKEGVITHYELQKPYVLQPKFNNGEKNVLPIVYVADFYIEYSDGRCEVVDIKGCADATAKIKRKMFWFHYPEIPYKWLTYVKKYGGWREYDEVNHLRRENAKNKKKDERTEENEECSEKDNDERSEEIVQEQDC